MKFETLYTVSAVATSERLSQQITTRDVPSHVWKLFCTYGTVKFLTYADVIEDAKQQTQTMWTQNFGIHTFLGTIRHGKTMHYDISARSGT